jgi:tungstate transport system substrate-binding protein
MRNEFVLAGPVEGAGVIAGQSDIVGALRAIAGSGRPFVSRGDDSGTHQREQQLWAAAGVPADSAFIIVAGAGMADTLDRAARERAFTLSDRATYLTRRGAGELVIVFQGGAELDNVYSALEPAAATQVDAPGARAWVEFLRSEPGRSLIGGFGVQVYGEPLFTPVD